MPSYEKLKVPVYVFLSSFNSNPTFKKDCKEQGVDHFFAKPLGSSDKRRLLKFIS